MNTELAETDAGLRLEREVWMRHPRQRLDRLDEATDRVDRIEVDAPTVTINAEGVNLRHGYVTSVAHLGHDRVD